MPHCDVFVQYVKKYKPVYSANPCHIISFLLFGIGPHFNQPPVSFDLQVTVVPTRTGLCTLTIRYLRGKLTRLTRDSCHLSTQQLCLLSPTLCQSQCCRLLCQSLASKHAFQGSAAYQGQSNKTVQSSFMIHFCLPPEGQEVVNLLGGIISFFFHSPCLQTSCKVLFD